MYICVRSIVLVRRSMISLNGTEEGFTKQRASINVCYLKVTSLVVIIVYSNIPCIDVRTQKFAIIVFANVLHSQNS